MTVYLGQQFGDYRLIRELGEGGFGFVYLGEHVANGTKAAVKVLKAKLTAEALTEFINEARTFRLKHPNIIQLLDFGIRTDGIPYLVTEYLPNGSLRTLHRPGTRLPLSTVLAYMKQVAAALQYAHDARLIHRDVKPDNMLVGRNNEILLSDFGIAVIAHSTRSQKTEQVIGSWIYTAPEQFKGKSQPASDQYALGIVVYEWLCGSPPFQGSFPELYHQHLSVAPPSLRNRISTISPNVERVVVKALAKNPNERYSSVKEFAKALEQAAKPPAQKRGISRRTVLLGGLGTLAIVAVGGTVWWVLSPHPLYTCDGQSPVAWSPDGRYIVSGGRFAQAAVPGGRLAQAVLWNAANGGKVWTRGNDAGEAYCLAWSPDGKRIACGGNKIVQIWDVTNGSNISTYSSHSNQVSSVAWSPDGRRIASGGDDETVQVWDAADGGHVFTYHSSGTSVAWSPDGRRIASGSGDQQGGGTVQVWDAADGGHVFTYHGHSSVVQAVAWSPDSRRIASGGDDETVQVWDAMNGGNIFNYRGHSSTIFSIAWSPDGKRIASASDDHTAQVWDVADGGNTHTFKIGGSGSSVVDVTWSPDGKRIASAADVVQVWQVL